MKKWEIINKEKAEKGNLDALAILKILLANRGISKKEEIDEFLNPKDPKDLKPNDVGIKQAEITKAIKRLNKAIGKEEKIIVYGDYDTDGVCATAILWNTLKKLKANVLPYIPCRDEGYGLKEDKILEFAENGVKIIITVDQGIVAFKQAELAKEKGIDLIITDHHTSEKKIPKAFAIIHTTKLSGAGVSWFLASHLGGDYLDLATIGTISDLMPLNGVNRDIVYYGLKDLKKTNNLGLKALFMAAAINQEEIGTYEIGYLIGPRLNAAGRIKDPMDALRLLCTKNSQQAQVLAKEIDSQNKERQLLTEKLTIHARNLWLARESKSKLIFLSDEIYEEGVIGLVAGKLTEEFFRPTVIVSKREMISKASARSIAGFNIIEAIRSCMDILGPHGGHPLAAGFSVETQNLEEIKKRLEDLAEEQIGEEQLKSVLKIDLEIPFDSLNFLLMDQIEKMAPFGFGNPQPVFLTKNVKITEIKSVGKDGKHLKFSFFDQKSNSYQNGIGFNQGDKKDDFLKKETVDIVFNLAEDFWNNNHRLQLKIIDIQ